VEEVEGKEVSGGGGGKEGMGEEVREKEVANEGFERGLGIFWEERVTNESFGMGGNFYVWPAWQITCLF
jgi:hypothetical protein